MGKSGRPLATPTGSVWVAFPASFWTALMHAAYLIGAKGIFNDVMRSDNGNYMEWAYSEPNDAFIGIYQAAGEAVKWSFHIPGFLAEFTDTIVDIGRSVP
jgi:hypothetical protein